MIMTEQEIREVASEHAASIGRDIEYLLNLMNQNEDAFVVSDENTIIYEDELHDHIGKYLRLSRSLEGEKPE